MLQAEVLININSRTCFELSSKLVEYVVPGKALLNWYAPEQDSSAEFLRDYSIAALLCCDPVLTFYMAFKSILSVSPLPLGKSLKDFTSLPSLKFRIRETVAQTMDSGSTVI